ncbi:MAG TPA: glycosyltransferase family 39 protein, partial [Bacteroidota bacterium]|nr:glycosyltransferase family 39 protein [Bacteroidota bacterium]
MLRLNDLSFYTPDSSRYLIWGNSLAHGKGFVDETLPDPDPYIVHAPLYSLLSAPVEFFAPYSTVMVKAWTLLWGVLAILLLYAWLCRTVGKSGALVGSILFAANPLFWLYSTEVLSDAPFIAAVLAVFYLCERICATEERKLSEQIFLLLAVLFASMVREVGATVAVAAVVYLFLNKRFKEPIVMLLVTGALITLWYVRNNVYAATAAEYAGGNMSLVFRKLMTSSDSSLINEFALRIWLTFRSYASQIPGLIFYPMFEGHFGHLFYIPSSFSIGLENLITAISGILEPIVDILIIIGLVRDFASGKKMLIRGFFVVFYGGAILLYPINDVRFLVPLIPLGILYLMKGINWISKKFPLMATIRQTRYAVLLAVVMMVPNLVSAIEML